MARGIKFGMKCVNTQRQLDLQPHSPYQCSVYGLTNPPGILINIL